jgi:Tfp pilus assembly protein PilF
MAKRSKKRPEVSVEPHEVVAAGWVLVVLRAAVIIGVGLWVYAPVLHGDWLWDDHWYITGNPLLRHVGGLWDFWFRPGSWVEYYPIHETLLWIEWQLFGSDTLGYHLVTIALHLANALLVWRLFAKLGLAKAWLGGLIFAVHPANVDSVAWIVETKNTLSLLPFLLAMGAWVDHAGKGRARDYGWALSFFVVAMLCKITMAPFAALILLYAWWKNGRIGGKDLVACAPFGLIALGLIALNISCSVAYLEHQAKVIEPLPLGGFLMRGALAGQLLAFYFAHCFWPVGLLPSYPQWTVDAASPLDFLPWLAMAGLIAWLWARRAGWGAHALLGLGFFVIFLVPFIGFIGISYMSFTWGMDHFLYIPMIGLIGLVVAAIGSIESRIPLTARPILTGTITALAALLAFVANGYAVAYSDEATLWGYTVERHPDYWRAQDNLGLALLRLERPQEAMPHLLASLQLRPNREQVHLDLGRALVATDRVADGIAEYDRAIAINPEDPDVYNQKGVALMQSGRFDEAQAQFETAMKLRPNYTIALDNLGSALAQSGHLPEALGRFAEALATDPDDLSTLDNEGSALLQSGRNGEALAAFQHALRVDPSDAKAQQGVAKLQAGAPQNP